MPKMIVHDSIRLTSDLHADTMCMSTVRCIQISMRNNAIDLSGLKKKKRKTSFSCVNISSSLLVVRDRTEIDVLGRHTPIANYFVSTRRHITNIY
jgi:hypothetical protein